MEQFRKDLGVRMFLVICVSTICEALLLMMLWTNAFGVKNGFCEFQCAASFFSIHVLNVFAPIDVPELLPRFWLNRLIFFVLFIFGLPTYDRRLELLL